MSTAPIPTKKLLFLATIEALAVVAGFWLVLVAFWVLESLHFWYDDSQFGTKADVQFAIQLFVALGGGVALAIALRRRVLRSRAEDLEQAVGSLRGPWSQLCSRSRVLRVTRVVLAAGYLLTWIFGVPEAISDAGRVDVENAERVAAEYQKPVAPVRSWSAFGFPILPGLVVTHHAHLGGRLHGWGGLKLYLWWGSGVKQLKEAVTWLT